MYELPYQNSQPEAMSPATRAAIMSNRRSVAHTTLNRKDLVGWFEQHRWRQYKVKTSSAFDYVPFFPDDPDGAALRAHGMKIRVVGKIIRATGTIVRLLAPEPHSDKRPYFSCNWDVDGEAFFHSLLQRDDGSVAIDTFSVDGAWRNVTWPRLRGSR